MAGLSPTELGKRNNFDIFISRVRTGKDFTVVEGKGKKVKLNRSIAEQIKSIQDFEKYRKGSSIFLPTASNSEIRLTQIYKDSEFSGRTQKTTAAEDAEVTSLNEQLKTIMEQTGVDYVPVKVGKKTYNVVSVTSTPGTPKSDFSFVDVNGRPVGHISHKDGSNPRGFQQWAGTSQRVEPRIYAHKETQDFINTLKQMYPNGLPPASTIGRKIKDEKLKKMAVYGSMFGGAPCINNVDVTLQGKVKLVKQGTTYKLTGAAHENANGSIISGGYEPIFLAVYKGDRSDHGIKGARITINPRDGRTVKQYI